MKKTFSMVALAAIVLSSTVACGSTEPTGEESSEETNATESSTVSPGVVTDIGGLGDRGFNDLADAGLKQAEEEFGTSGKVLVPDTPADYASNLNNLAQNDFSPVFGIGFTYFDAITDAAAQFPDTHFGIVDAVVEAPNVVSLVFREEEGSYLAGVAAALMTQEETEYTSANDKVLGFIGGQESPLIEKFGAGFVQGAKSVCADCEVLFQYVGTSTDAFSDPGTAAEIADNMHAQGADVIYHAAGASGDGLFKSAQDNSYFAIGVNVDQATSVPDAPILTSVLKRVDTAIKAVIADEVEGEFEAGITAFGLADDGVALAPFGRFDGIVPDAVKDAVAKASDSIIDGSTTVATTLTEVEG